MHEWSPTFCGRWGQTQPRSYAHVASLHGSRAPIKIASLISLATGNQFPRISEEVDLIAHCYSNFNSAPRTERLRIGKLLECQGGPGY
jgi:hypothetical protein